MMEFFNLKYKGRFDLLITSILLFLTSIFIYKIGSYRYYQFIVLSIIFLGYFFYSIIMNFNSKGYKPLKINLFRDYLILILIISGSVLISLHNNENIEIIAKNTLINITGYSLCMIILAGNPTNLNDKNNKIILIITGILFVLCDLTYFLL